MSNLAIYSFLRRHKTMDLHEASYVCFVLAEGRAMTSDVIKDYLNRVAQKLGLVEFVLYTVGILMSSDCNVHLPNGFNAYIRLTALGDTKDMVRLVCKTQADGYFNSTIDGRTYRNGVGFSDE
jgi:hypothetical protein